MRFEGIWRQCLSKFGNDLIDVIDFFYFLIDIFVKLLINPCGIINQTICQMIQYIARGVS